MKDLAKDAAQPKDNPLEVPDELGAVRMDIDWSRRVVRIQQVPNRFAISAATIYMPFFAAKGLVGQILSGEASQEYQQRTNKPVPEEEDRPGRRIIQ